MPAKRELTMRQLRYMLRLHHDGVSAREIGRTLGVARSTIQDNLWRAQASGIAWPVPAELTDDILEQRLFARGGTKAGLRRRSEPDWGTLARELKRAGVTVTPHPADRLTERLGTGAPIPAGELRTLRRRGHDRRPCPEFDAMHERYGGDSRTGCVRRDGEECWRARYAAAPIG